MLSSVFDDDIQIEAIPEPGYRQAYLSKLAIAAPDICKNERRAVRVVLGEPGRRRQNRHTVRRRQRGQRHFDKDSWKLD